MQDASVQESMGLIQDRTRENLVSTDNGVIMARHRLAKAARDLAKGIEPPAIQPATHQVRSVSIVLPPEVAFKDAAKAALHPTPGSAHTTV
jgi:phthalate 4,5-dioxygenase